MRRRNRTASAALALAMLGALPALAAAPQAPVAEPAVAPPPAPAWRVTVMPYVWASGLSGSVRPFAGAPNLAFRRSFPDTLRDLDGALFLAFGAERGRFVLLGDASRVSLSRAGLLPGGIPAEGSTRITTLTLAAGYRTVDTSAAALDLFAGFRTVELRAGVQVAAGALSRSPSRSYVDPILGARATLALSPRWSTMLYADVGGFGVGTRLSVVASALLNYQLTDRAMLSGGYRQMWVDYDKRGTRVDVRVGGPVLGVSWRF